MGEFMKEKGLLNSTGENNCFLNVVIQGLWHFSAFRNQFLDFPEHKHVGSDENSCITCALAMIFAQFQFGDSETLTPVSLRSAMSQLFEDENKFQLGKLVLLTFTIPKATRLMHQKLWLSYFLFFILLSTM